MRFLDRRRDKRSIGALEAQCVLFASYERSRVTENIRLLGVLIRADVNARHRNVDCYGDILAVWQAKGSAFLPVPAYKSKMTDLGSSRPVIKFQHGLLIHVPSAIIVLRQRCGCREKESTHSSWCRVCP